MSETLRARTQFSLRQLLLTILSLGLLSLLTMSTVQAQGAFGEPIGPVFALRGTLSEAENQAFGNFLVLENGTQIGLAGETPAIEATIIELRTNNPNGTVKVWGDRYPAVIESGYDFIVVEDIQPSDGTTPNPVEPGTQPVAVVNVAAVNIRSGPGLNYSVVDVLIANQRCLVIGRNEAATWWFLNCNNSVSGWVRGDLLALSGNTDTVPVVEPGVEPNVSPTATPVVTSPPVVGPTATPIPPPTATPVPTRPQYFSAWRADYYANRDLNGSPVLTQNVETLDFIWGNGSPGSTVPVDNFSAVFERTLNFSYGNYLIQLRADDGVRLYIDGQIVVNDWTVGPARDRNVRRILSGAHTFRIEYFEAQGVASLQLNIRLLSDDQSWQTSYYGNRDLAGAPLVVRDEPRGGQFPIDFNWALGSPVPGVIPANNWSSRWQGTFFFEGGDYRFQTNVDDGIRVYIDGILLIDRWENGFKNNVTADFRQLGAGNHRITVEHYDSTSGAYLRLWWTRLNADSDPDRERD